MILGIGTDMVEVARMQSLLDRHGDNAIRRILAQEERADFAASTQPARFLAKRFAVKEAFSKAWGSGLRAPVLLTSISIGHDALGKPLLHFSAELEQFCQARGLSASHVSISDERLYALAFVVLEGNAAARDQKLFNPPSIL
jgi:holo-[acyl-carrier protein] synthase